MLDRLKCCIYILFSKQYAVFTSNDYKVEKFGYWSFRGANHAFLQMVIKYVEKINEIIKSIDE